MDKKEVVKKSFEDFSNFYSYNEITDDLVEQKMIYLSRDIIGYITYDFGLDIEIGYNILEVLKIIRDRNNFEYIEDKDKYKNYIFVANLIKSWLDWGSSIRGAWFDFYDGKMIYSETLCNIGCDEDFIRLDEEFINWFIDWLETK